MNAEPSEARPRQRQLGTWLLVAMLVLLFASSAVMYRVMTMANPPDHVQIWKLRGEVLVNQLRYGRDDPSTRFARKELSFVLMDQGAYASAEKQWRSQARSYERAF